MNDNTLGWKKAPCGCHWTQGEWLIAVEISVNDAVRTWDHGYRLTRMGKDGGKFRTFREASARAFWISAAELCEVAKP